jgi:hypothetical protein
MVIEFERLGRVTQVTDEIPEDDTTAEKLVNRYFAGHVKKAFLHGNI